MITRRTLFLALAATSLAAPLRAEGLSLQQISDYLNKMTTAKARFTQFNSDGSMSLGTLYIKRPGRARFEYDPPENALVMAGGGQVAIFDSKSNLPPEQYPLKRTPLNLILERNVDLSRREMVIGKRSDATSTTIVAQDPEHPEYGTIELVFTSNPVELRQWIIVDEAGTQTRVILEALETGADMPSTLFNITVESEKRGF